MKAFAPLVFVLRWQLYLFIVEFDLICGDESTQFLNFTKETWEKEYEKGEWKYLNQLPVELARSAIIINVFYRKFSPHGKILDVGCGNGAIAEFLAEKQLELYMGIDISETSVNDARNRFPVGAKFEQSTAEKFNVDARLKFDCIIFNEVLYYTDHVAIMKKYSEYLNVNGIFIISVWSAPRHKQYMNVIFKDASALFHKVDDYLEVSGVSRGRQVHARVGIFKLKD